MTKYQKQTDRIGVLFDLAVRRMREDRGFTKAEAADELDVTEAYAYKLIRQMRAKLHEQGWILPCDPNPDDPSGQYVFKLGETLRHGHSWRVSRYGYLSTSLDTLVGEARSLLATHDGRSRNGRIIRSIDNDLTHVRSKMGELVEEVEAA